MSATVASRSGVAPADRVPKAARGDTLRRRALEALSKAINQAVASASDETLAAIVGATDPGQALAIAPRDLAPPPPERLAAEREAKARTAEFRSELARKAGGMYSRTDVADLLGVTPAAIDKQRQRRQLLGVPYGTEIRFPAAQFSGGGVVSDLKPMLEAFSDMNPWGQLQLLLAPLEGFGDHPQTILDMLRTGVDQLTKQRLISLVRGWAV